MNGPARRIAASPYARRLARERGLALENLTGSGPVGRIIAADVPTCTPEALQRPAPVTRPALHPPGALACTIDLAPVRALLEAAMLAGAVIGLDDVLIKAVACASRMDPPTGDTIRWFGEGAVGTVIAQAKRLPLSGIAACRRAAQPSHGGGALSVARISQNGIRPLGAAMPDHSVLHIVVSALDDSPAAEALLLYETNSIVQAEAAAMLAAIRDGLEQPLRLLA